MTFLSVLLLAIAMTIIQIGTIYNKGTVVKEINQSGRSIADDIKRTSAAANSFSVATDYVSSPAGGRLCLGNYSYIWNTAYTLEQDPGNANLTPYEGSSLADKPLHFVKVPDSSRIYCQKSGPALTYKFIRSADTAQAQELLPSGDHSLTVTQLALPSVDIVSDPTTNQTIYTLVYALGSGTTKAMNATQTACLDPSNSNSDLSYCTVQQFTITLRTGNG